VPYIQVQNICIASFPKVVEQRQMCVTAGDMKQGINEMCVLEGKLEAGHGQF
jgi:hypothetical protein